MLDNVRFGAETSEEEMLYSDGYPLCTSGKGVPVSFEVAQLYCINCRN